MLLKNSKLEKAVEEFNAIRYPECYVEIEKWDNDKLIARFKGTKAGFACCFDENFIDFTYYVRDIAGMEIEIADITRPLRDEFQVVYTVRR